MSERRRNVGPWTLGEQLGQGGNATVFRATRDGLEQPIALKVIWAATSNDTYRRFANEVAILRHLHGEPGILPLLDAHIPEAPSEDDPPWLAMPEATLIADALADASTEAIITAVREIAVTLAHLAAAHELGHRDLKPRNLYRYAEAWVVGDFGLVRALAVRGMTGPRDRIGAAGYMPSEMLSDPAHADANAADVYSLAKVLWVLVCDQRWPPVGFQPADQVGSRISDLRPGPRSADLDRLVAECTRIDPAARPTMAGFAEDLGIWLTPRVSSARPLKLDQSDKEKLLATFASQVGERESDEQRRERAFDARDRLLQHLEPLAGQLSEITAGAVSESHNDNLTRLYAGTPEETGADVITWREAFAWVATVGEAERNPQSLRIGYCLELTATWELLLGGLLAALPDEYAGGETDRIGQRRAQLGSLAADRMIEQFVEDVHSRLPAMPKSFLRLVGG
jgi:serine/threonine protein kinase